MLSPCDVFHQTILTGPLEPVLVQQTVALDLDLVSLQLVAKRGFLQRAHRLHKRPEISCVQGDPTANFVRHRAVVVATLVHEKQVTHPLDSVHTFWWVLNYKL
ncbi:MAG: hypothetical protein WBQ43_08150 [Terriglobales bacterium]